jgi:hypothetical protein
LSAYYINFFGKEIFMNRKWLPHFIAAGALVVFIVLGLACASTPSEGGSTSSTVPEGYGQFTISNMSSNHSIVQITVNGGNEKKFSQTYQVNLRPKGSGMLAMGGSKDIGEIVGDYYKPVVPIGNYEVTLRWSNGAQTTHRENITSRGIIANYNQ